VKVTTTQRYTRIKGHRMEEAMMTGLDYLDDPAEFRDLAPVPWDFLEGENTDEERYSSRRSPRP
jgi:hypothetical protein